MTEKRPEYEKYKALYEEKSQAIAALLETAKLAIEHATKIADDNGIPYRLDLEAVQANRDEYVDARSGIYVPRSIPRDKYGEAPDKLSLDELEEITGFDYYELRGGDGWENSSARC